MPAPKDPTKLEDWHKNLSISAKRRSKDPIWRQRQSETHQGLQIGMRNPFFGKTHTEETKEKLREARTGTHHSETTRLKMSMLRRGRPSPKKGIPAPLSDEGRRRLREANHGERAHSWKGGISFEPYCPKFNRPFKERVRVFFGHKCVECGTSQNGTKLDVHHVNFNKMSCCDGAKPLFVTLCRSCHAKTQFNREYWKERFTGLIHAQYNGQCYSVVGGVS